MSRNNDYTLILLMWLVFDFRISELMAEHEAQRQEDQLALQEKEKRITELEEALLTRAQVEEHLEEQRKVGVALGVVWVW